STGGYG
nr:Chain A, RNA-binding protein FUS [Homo sapiens]6BZP_B Chain B, RNA-binding protein FUS [Homo sapiens]